jgi:hypothetical protein
MFGHTSLIEKIDRQLVPKETYFSRKMDRVFYTGGLYHHQSDEFGVNVDRFHIYNQIKNLITNPGYMHNNVFLNYISNSKFSLDLLGAGNPNIRTFEILISGSLLLQEKNDLIWPFSEKFSEECYFKDGMEFNNNLYKLNHNPELYLSCLEHQYNIVNKYFNKEWLKNYILSKIIIDQDKKCLKQSN